MQLIRRFHREGKTGRKVLFVKLLLNPMVGKYGTK